MSDNSQANKLLRLAILAGHGVAKLRPIRASSARICRCMLASYSVMILAQVVACDVSIIVNR